MLERRDAAHHGGSRKRTGKIAIRHRQRNLHAGRINAVVGGRGERGVRHVVAENVALVGGELDQVQFLLRAAEFVPDELVVRQKEIELIGGANAVRYTFPAPVCRIWIGLIKKSRRAVSD